MITVVVSWERLGCYLEWTALRNILDITSFKEQTSNCELTFLSSIPRDEEPALPSPALIPTDQGFTKLP